MGKMKEVFAHYFNEHPDASDAEYQDWLYSNGLTTATQYDKESQYDAWWNSLTDEQKQQLYEEQESYEKEHMEREMDIEDILDMEDEMNHDLGFGK